MPATVLVCDNEDVLRTLVRAALGDRGYNITEARDGDESLELARETQPDLIILDELLESAEKGERNNGSSAGQDDAAAESARERYASLVRERVAWAEAQVSEQDQEELTEALPEHVWTALVDGTVEYANAQCLNYFGRSREEGVG